MPIPNNTVEEAYSSEKKLKVYNSTNKDLHPINKMPMLDKLEQSNGK